MGEDEVSAAPCLYDEILIIPKPNKSFSVGKLMADTDNAGDGQFFTFHGACI